MTRLLFLAAFFAGSLAYVQRHDMKRDGYTGGGYAGGGQGQYVHADAGNGEVLDITYNVVDKGQEGSTPVQNAAMPMATSGVTHEVCEMIHLLSWLTTDQRSRSSWEALRVSCIRRIPSRQLLATWSNSASCQKITQSLSLLSQSRVSNWRAGMILGSCLIPTTP